MPEREGPFKAEKETSRARGVFERVILFFSQSYA